MPYKAQVPPSVLADAKNDVHAVLPVEKLREYQQSTFTVPAVQLNAQIADLNMRGWQIIQLIASETHEQRDSTLITSYTILATRELAHE